MPNLATLEQSRDDFSKAVMFLGQAVYPEIFVSSAAYAFRYILRGSQQGTLTATERDGLIRYLIRAYAVGRDAMPKGYDRRQLDVGFAGARGLAEKWGTPVERRHLRDPKLDDVCATYARMLLNDLENINLAEMMHARVGRVVLPPMPTKVEHDGCEIVPFPKPRRPQK